MNKALRIIVIGKRKSWRMDFYIKRQKKQANLKASKLQQKQTMSTTH